MVRPVLSRTVWVFAALLMCFAACGQSSADKAKEDVCSARDDIGKQVDELKSLTLTTATTSQVRDSLQSIRDDLAKIAKARGDLSDDRRQEVDAANQKFRAALAETTANLGKSVSLADAVTQVKQSLQQLAATYKSSFEQIDCG
jgi:cell division protein FtsB